MLWHVYIGLCFIVCVHIYASDTQRLISVLVSGGGMVAGAWEASGRDPFISCKRRDSCHMCVACGGHVSRCICV